MSFIVDASIAIKWLIDEPLRAEARRLLQLHGPFYAPDLFFAEVANVGWKMVMRDEIDSDQAVAMILEVGHSLSRVFSSSLLHERALAIALALKHPVYDCLYLACAELADTVLVTADKRLCAAVAGGPYAHLVRHLSEVVA